MAKRKNKEETIRSFIAVELSAGQRQEIQKIVDEVSTIDANITYTEPENLHITVKFLGNIKNEDLEKLQEECTIALQNQNSFTLSLDGVGVFESWEYLKVLWIGIENGKNEISIMHRLLTETITVGGKEIRKFHPHATIARVKGPKNKQLLSKKFKEFSDTVVGSYRVESVKVKQSHLGPNGPRYQDLFEIPLKKLTIEPPGELS